MISITTVVWVVVYLLVGGAIFGLLSWIIDSAPFMPAGWKPIAKWILLVMAVLVLIGVLLSLVNGTSIIRMNNRAPIFNNRVVEKVLSVGKILRIAA
jgi:hypothetical protein